MMKKELLAGIEKSINDGSYPDTQAEVQKMMAGVMVMKELRYEASILSPGQNSMNMIMDIGGGPDFSGQIVIKSDYTSGKDLLDPWARAVSDRLWDRKRAARPGDNGTSSMRAVVIEEDYDWEGDERLCRPLEESVIYELHVKGFSKLHPEVPEPLRGTYAGLASEAAIARWRRASCAHRPACSRHRAPRPLTRSPLLSQPAWT